MIYRDLVAVPWPGGPLLGVHMSHRRHIPPLAALLRPHSPYPGPGSVQVRPPDGRVRNAEAITTI